MAGKATFTIKNAVTGGRFTYRVTKSEPTEKFKDVCWFVMVLTGPNNQADYRFVGRITSFPGNPYVHSPKAPIGEDAPSIRALKWFWGHLDDLRTVEFCHEGKCCRCGRALTVPESVAIGVGPECAAKMGRSHTLLAAQAMIDDEF